MAAAGRRAVALAARPALRLWALAARLWRWGHGCDCCACRRRAAERRTLARLCRESRERSRETLLRPRLH